jgi:hypothetical protein
MADPGAGTAVAGVDAARPGAGAAGAEGGVAARGVGAAGDPDEELCTVDPTLPEPDSAGHGAVFWPTARVAEIRNNHIMFVCSFMQPPRMLFRVLS